MRARVDATGLKLRLSSPTKAGRYLLDALWGISLFRRSEEWGWYKGDGVDQRDGNRKGPSSGRE